MCAKKLVLFQKYAICLINKSSYSSHISLLFQKYSVLKFNDIYTYYSAVFMYKYTYKNLPHVCYHFLTLKPFNTNSYNIFVTRINFFIPSIRTSIRAKYFLLSGPRFWSSLTAGLLESPSLNTIQVQITYGDYK